MKKFLLVVLAILTAMIYTGCKSDDVKGDESNEAKIFMEEKEMKDLGISEDTIKKMPQLQALKTGDELAILHTNMGDIKIKLFREQAPKTVENFVQHIKDGYYDGIIFHRVIKDFMIQGGDPTGTGMGGESIYGESFEDEFSQDLINIRGALSMANAGPNTNGSQFFIVQNSKQLEDSLVDQMAELAKEGQYPVTWAEMYKAFGGAYHLDGKHTVFGQVISGMDVVDKIAGVETDAMDKPVEDVVIESAEVIEEK